jgi:hypothetical protein
MIILRRLAGVLVNPDHVVLVKRYDDNKTIVKLVTGTEIVTDIADPHDVYSVLQGLELEHGILRFQADQAARRNAPQDAPYEPQDKKPGEEVESPQDAVLNKPDDPAEFPVTINDTIRAALKAEGISGGRDVYGFYTGPGYIRPTYYSYDNNRWSNLRDDLRHR